MQVDSSALIELLDAAMAADYTRLRRIGSRMARALAENDDMEGAKAIQSLLRQRAVPLQTSGYSEALPRDAGSRLPLIEEGQWPSTPVLLGDQEGRAVSRFLEDARNIELLSRKGVSARLGLLMHGPPGSGKTLLAGHIAAQLQRPIYIVRLDSLISSRLGETAKNIRGVFEFIPQQQAVLFLDEMDAIAKVRDDRHELGELKRVVNTVLQGLDSLSDDVVVIGATNHAHLLDPAIWRRFPYKVELKMPDAGVRAAMWTQFLFEGQGGREADAKLLASLSDGLSGADVENIALAARRRAILDGAFPSMPHILNAVIGSRAGAPNLIDDCELTLDDRRRLALDLRDKAGMTVTDVAKVIGVSRQMAHRYLPSNEASHAD
jgi:KaiC/GvpD/RAD55 family RecA-like ATPase